MAIDKVALARFKRTAKALTSFVPEGLFDDYPRPTGEGFDPDKARALLAEAGYKDANGNYDPSTFPVSVIDISYNTTETI